MLERWETEHKKESISLQNQLKVTVCHPERRKTLAFCAVEVLLSEERYKTEERMRRRDLLTSLGGLPRQM